MKFLIEGNKSGTYAITILLINDGRVVDYRVKQLTLAEVATVTFELINKINGSPISGATIYLYPEGYNQDYTYLPTEAINGIYKFTVPEGIYEYEVYLNGKMLNNGTIDIENSTLIRLNISLNTSQLASSASLKRRTGNGYLNEYLSFVIILEVILTFLLLRRRRRWRTEVLRYYYR